VRHFGAFQEWSNCLAGQARFAARASVSQYRVRILLSRIRRRSNEKSICDMARSGMLSTSSRMRFSNLMTPTAPTFRPKLRTRRGYCSRSRWPFPEAAYVQLTGPYAVGSPGLTCTGRNRLTRILWLYHAHRSYLSCSPAPSKKPCVSRLNAHDWEVCFGKPVKRATAAAGRLSPIV